VLLTYWWDGELDTTQLSSACLGAASELVQGVKTPRYCQFSKIVIVSVIMTFLFESQCVELFHLRTTSINRCVSVWNSLPSSLVKSKSVASFKHNLRCIDLSSFSNYVFRIWIYFLFIICELTCIICVFIFIPCDYQRYICCPIIIVFKLLLFYVSWSLKKIKSNK